MERSSLEQLIRESMKKGKEQQKEFVLFGRITARLLQPTIVSFSGVINRLEGTIPSHLFDEIDEIFIGSFAENEDRELEAHYESGAIYITSDLVSVEDYLENIIHETAHSLEQSRGMQIYGDKRLEKEFLGKRDTLRRALSAERYEVDALNFLDSEYSEEFDTYLHKQVGYENLHNITAGLFYSPYGATSISEYFANGFENFFLGNRDHLKRISPQLVKKIWELIEDEI